MMRVLKWVVAVALMGGAVGCKSKTESKAENDRSSAIAAPGAAPPSSVPGPPEGVGLDGVNMPISQLLGTERQSRPSDTLSAEQVFSAFEKGGLTLADKTQVLGRTIGASFCENAHTPAGVVFSVCEFKDAATATKGRDYSLRTFGKALPDRDLLIKQKTLLTITRGGPGGPAQTESKTATQIFQGLSG